MQAGIQWDRERLDPAFAGVTRRLAAEQLLLLIDIFLRHVAGGDERVHAFGPHKMKEAPLHK